MQYVAEQFMNRYGEQEGTILYKKLNNSKKHARSRGIEVSFDWQDIDMLAKPLLGYGLCDYTGQPFGEDDMKPSIERIDAAKGYERGNVCIVTVRANNAKNYIYDMKGQVSTFTPLIKETVRQMMETCTGDYMENLKTKYVPKINRVEDNQLEPHEVDIIQQYKDPEPEIEKPSLPDDVALAEQYAKWLRFMLKEGFDTVLSFADFKAMVKVKRCFITGQPLNDDKQPVILDPRGKIERGNVKFANAEPAEALNKLIDKSGLCMQDLVSNLKKIIK